MKLPVAVALTVSAIVVVAVSAPEVPVMVTVDVPAMAVLLAVNVSTLVPVVGLVRTRQLRRWAGRMRQA